MPALPERRSKILLKKSTSKGDVLFLFHRLIPE